MDCLDIRPKFATLTIWSFSTESARSSHSHNVFEASGRFTPLPPIPEALLAERLRREVLGFLVRREVILPPLADQMLAWRHSGFTVHNQVRVAAGDAEGRKSLAGYMLRAPFSLEKTTYDAARGAVICRSKLHATQTNT